MWALTILILTAAFVCWFLFSGEYEKILKKSSELEDDAAAFEKYVKQELEKAKRGARERAEQRGERCDREDVARADDHA